MRKCVFNMLKFIVLQNFMNYSFSTRVEFTQIPATVYILSNKYLSPTLRLDVAVS